MGLGNGNSKTGDKGSNYSYELKSLQGLQQSLTLLTGIATEGTLLQVLAAIIASDQDIEILLVRDEAVGNGNPVLKQITNYETGVPVVSYENVDGTPYVPAPNPVPVYVYLDPSAVLNLMLAELLDQGLSLDAIVTSTGLSATEVTQLLVDANLTLLNTKLNTLGQKASAASAPVVLSTEQEVLLEAIKVAVEGTPASTIITFGGQLRLIGNSGSTLLGCTSVAVINVGTSDGTMTSGFFGTIKPGEEQSWEAPAGSHLPSITFNANNLGAELVITFVQP